MVAPFLIWLRLGKYSHAIYLREGFNKQKTANYPHFVDKGGGPQMWISDGGEGSSHVDKKFLNVNIINFKKWISQGGGSDKVDI